jgi:Fe2+ transport system protein B
MMLIEDFKKGINNSLKEIQENTAKQVEVLKELQENTAKQVEVLKEETKKKSLKELQENTTKQVMELNKTIQDLKMDLETMKKTQRETALEIVFSVLFLFIVLLIYFLHTESLGNNLLANIDITWLKISLISLGCMCNSESFSTFLHYGLPG